MFRMARFYFFMIVVNRGFNLFPIIFINTGKYIWSRSMISSLYSIATLGSGLIITGVGRYIDKLGQRKMLMIVPVIFGLACFWMSIVLNPIMIFIGFLFLRLLGQGSMTLIPQTLIPHWFKGKRGFALSIMGLGGVIAPKYTTEK